MPNLRQNLDNAWFAQCERNHVSTDNYDESEFAIIDFNQADDYILVVNSKMRGGYEVDIDRLVALVDMYIEQRAKRLFEGTKVVIKLPVDAAPVMVAVIASTVVKRLPRNPIFGSVHLTDALGQSILYRIQ